MSTIVDIGSLITRSSEIPGGRPVITGTKTSVRSIARLYKQGASAEEISCRMQHLTLAQIYAALAYYQANREEIEADLAGDDELLNYLDNFKNFKEDIWVKGNRVIALASGGAFLGSFIAQVPGAIIGTIAGAVFGFFARVEKIS